MNKRKIIIYGFGTIITTLSLSLSIITSTVFSIVKASLPIDYSNPITLTKGEYTFIGYEFTDNRNTIALAWGLDPSLAPDDEAGLTITNDDYYDEAGVEHDYTIRAIAKGGFRYCDFKKIALPSSVQRIEEEAFAYCGELIEFSFPYQISEIAPSTFLDCRKLEHLFYLDENDNRVMRHEMIASIGDHAFDSCISLADFTCPVHLKYFGESCFQNCTSLVNFYFPTRPFIYYKWTEAANEGEDDWIISNDRPSISTDRDLSPFKPLTRDGLLNKYYYYKVDSNNKYYLFDGDDWVVTTAMPTGEGIINKGAVASTSQLPRIPSVGDFYSYTFGEPAVTKYYQWNGSIWDETDDKPSISTMKGSLDTIDELPEDGMNYGDFYRVFDNSDESKITVRPYAFANCSSLISVYFEPNMKEIDDYAFVGCQTDMHFKYTASVEPTFTREIENDDVNQGKWNNKYIATNLNDKYVVDLNEPQIEENSDLSCFKYSIKSDIIYLDSANLDSLDTLLGQENRTVTIDDEQSAYIEITKFETPLQTVGGEKGGYDISTGKVTIPNKIDGLPVKVIGQSAFANNTSIKSVKFNRNLVQICHQAFYHCTNIGKDSSDSDEPIDFSACEDLKEVSFSIFQHINKNDNTTNTNVKKLILPNCLEYIGGYAFANFTKINNFSFTPDNISNCHLKAMGDGAFYRLGKDVTNPAIHLLLPNTLNDQDAYQANFWHKEAGKKEENGLFNAFAHTNYNFHFALGKYAFDYAKAIVSVEFEEATTEQINAGANYTTSMYSNVFTRCTNIVKFKTNANLEVVGKDNFKTKDGNNVLVNNYREIFLYSEKGNSHNYPYPWGFDENTTKTIGELDNSSYGGSLFDGKYPELAIYVSGPTAPGSLSTYTLSSENSKQNINTKWNAETSHSYNNEFGPGDESTANNRSHISTVYNVDFDNVWYWNPTNGSKKNLKTNGGLKSLTDYQSGYISFAKDKTTNNYTAVRYFTDYDTGHFSDEINLSSIEGIYNGTTNKLTVIGDEAFAANDTNKSSGLYFILPNSITTIGERAFFHKADKADNIGKYGVRIITFYDNSSIQSIDTTPYYDGNNASWKKSCDSGTKSTLTGFCYLPKTVTYIGRNAFYNNVFGKIKLCENVAFIGNGAFMCAAEDKLRIGRASSIEFYDGDDSGTDVGGVFAVVSSGIYYINGGKKILAYQPSGHTGELSISSGTNAIGMRACANVDYTSVELAIGLTTIYGGGFQRSKSLTTVTGVESLRYIGAMEDPVDDTNVDSDYTEVWNSSVGEHFDNIDFRDFAYAPRAQINSLYGAFEGCSKFATVDFTKMTDLRKIGWSAFNGTALTNMTGNAQYNIKRYNGTNITDVDGATNLKSGVLDLRNCLNLRSINVGAFYGCSKIKYALLPDTKTDGEAESNIYIGYDPDGQSSKSAIFNNKTMILVGETCKYSNRNVGYSSANISNHYPDKCFVDKADNIDNAYYYVENVSTDFAASNQHLKYWTYCGSDIILFDDYDNAVTYGIDFLNSSPATVNISTYPGSTYLENSQVVFAQIWTDGSNPSDAAWYAIDANGRIAGVPSGKNKIKIACFASGTTIETVGSATPIRTSGTYDIKKGHTLVYSGSGDVFNWV